MPRPHPHPAVAELAPTEVAERLRGDTPPLLVDVREPWEHEIAHVAGARLVPLGTLTGALDTLDRTREIVLLCHLGVRSLMAAQFLQRHGFARVANLRGGIDAWSNDVDPSVPRY